MINEEIKNFAFAYYVRQQQPKEWKKLYLEAPPREFTFWFRDKKNEVGDYYLRLQESQIQITYPGHTRYPQSFLNSLESPPLLLFYIGNPVWITHSCISVVGSRKMTPQSKNWLNTDLHQYLQQTQKVLVSGGARGVDQESHFQALRLSLPTIIALPSGLHNLYPQELTQWQNDVLKKGGVFISEYFPKEPMRTFHFVQRNRLIASLGKSLLIIQGERRSGSLMTAKLALELGQNIGVIPGHPMDTAYSGNIELLKWGANPIFDWQDLLLFCP
jgi:DNA processing protein